MAIGEELMDRVDSVEFPKKKNAMLCLHVDHLNRLPQIHNYSPDFFKP